MCLCAALGHAGLISSIQSPNNPADLYVECARHSVKATLRIMPAVSSMRELPQNLKVTIAEERDHEQRWREISEELGPEVVRARFGARMSVWGDRYGEKLPPNDFIVAWLAEKYAISRKLDAQRFLMVALMTFATLIATSFTLVAAWIAAYPVLCRWLPDAWTSLKRLCS